MSFPGLNELIKKLQQIADELSNIDDKANRVLDKTDTTLDKANNVLDRANSIINDTTSILAWVKVVVLVLFAMMIIGFLIFFSLKTWTAKCKTRVYQRIEMEPFK